MGVFTAQAEEVGRTSSKSMNDNLKVLMGIEAGDDENFEKQMKAMAKNDPKGLQDLMKQAASMQAKEDDKNRKTADQLAAIQENATMSIADKIENIIKYLLEQIYAELQGILGVIDKLWSWTIGDQKTKDTLKALEKQSKIFESAMAGQEGGAEKAAAVRDVTSNISQSLEMGMSAQEMAKSGGLREQLSTLSDADLKRFLESHGMKTEARTGTETEVYGEMIKKLEPMSREDMIKAATEGFSAIKPDMNDFGDRVDSAAMARMMQDLAMDLARSGGLPKRQEKRPETHAQRQLADQLGGFHHYRPPL
jgi:hypothetical protein